MGLFENFSPRLNVSKVIQAYFWLGQTEIQYHG